MHPKLRLLKVLVSLTRLLRLDHSFPGGLEFQSWGSEGFVVELSGWLGARQPSRRQITGSRRASYPRLGVESCWIHSAGGRASSGSQQPWSLLCSEI